jgi:hypothetical protein
MATISHLPRLEGSVTALPSAIERKTQKWAASETLAHLPDAPRDYQQQVLRELLYALGLMRRPVEEPIEVAL